MWHLTLSAGDLGLLIAGGVAAASATRLMVHTAALRPAPAADGARKRNRRNTRQADSSARLFSLAGPILLALAVGAGATVATSHLLADEPAAEPAPITVKTAVVSQADWPGIVGVPATVSAVDTANLASRAGGWVTSVKVNAGAHVKKGDLIAEIGTVDLKSQLRQAEEQLNAAKATYDQAEAQEKRYAKLNRKHYASTEQYQSMVTNFLSAKAGLASAKAAVTAARSNLEYAELRAPFDGIVAEKKIWTGDYATPGAALFVIASNTPEIRAEVGPATFSKLKLGDTATVVVNGTLLPAVVIRLVAAADPTTRTHLVELRLQGKQAAAYGSYAEVEFSLGHTPALTVPVAALTERAGLLSVFVVDDNHRAHLRLVRTGERRDGKVTIVAGLSVGETVIIGPPASLANGARVARETTRG